MARFSDAFQERTNTRFSTYPELHAYSARHFRQFWKTFFECAEGLEWSGSLEPVCIGDECESAVFFPHVELNYAENALGKQIASDDSPALTCCHADGQRMTWSRGALREQVMRLAETLQRLGLNPGDRVVAIMRNDGDAIIAALAVTALGATLSTVAPENGVQAILDRFTPLAPRMLFAHTTPRAFDTGGSVTAAAATVVSALPTVTDVVLLDETLLPSTIARRQHRLRDLIAEGDADRFEFRRFPFNHPLFIMFSSGTTGKPKCIVHGAGGTLIEHVKEHRLHSALGPGDKLFFQTSCSWMMWQWQLSALASGVEIVTYDGAVSAVDTLWRIVEKEGVTVFGTSPAYLKMSEDAALSPGQQFDLSALRAMMSTGAVLHDAQFLWVRDNVKPLQLQSISGGTDIIGCFVLGNPDLPVPTGEAQCKSLGLDVQAMDEHGALAAKGELVCMNPFPSRPLGFIDDEDGSRFHRTYFAAHPGVWTHGDLIEFSPQGSARLYGRSDGRLNVRGINVSPGEIYRILATFDEIAQAMAIPQTFASSPEEQGERVVLLIVLRSDTSFDASLVIRIRHALLSRGSAALVPDVIAQVSALPVTHNGKPSEAAARDALNGVPARNVQSIKNPECLEALALHPALSRTPAALPAPGTTLPGIEQYLCALWERYLGFSPIGRSDNFFQLGGHSLLAARMLADIKRATGRALPLATFIIAPTISRLATVIVSEPRPEAGSPMLIEMRAGRGRPLFIVHSVTGSVMESLTLANVLQSERPVYGIQAQGLDGEEKPLSSVEAMAKSYVECVRKLQPEGPYALLGFSFGGLIAYEMAQELSAAKQDVETLFLIDPYLHERCLPLGAWLRYQVRMIGERFRMWRSFEGHGRIRYFYEKAADHVRMRLGKRALRPAPETRGLPAALLQVRESMRLATITYKPRPYLGDPVTLISASIKEEGRGDPLPAWRRAARSALRVVQVKGSHNDLLVEPQVALIADMLDNELARG